MFGPRDSLPHRPRRVLVTGTSGSGKTALAAAVGARWDLPHQEIDALHHGPGWVQRPEFVGDVTALAARPEWVTEWRYGIVRPLLLTRAQRHMDTCGCFSAADGSHKCPCGGEGAVMSVSGRAAGGAAGRGRVRRAAARPRHRRRYRARRTAVRGRGVRVRVLGVDPGLTRCGLGVVDGSGGRQVRCVAVDVVRSPPDAPLEQRLLAVGAVVEQWIEHHRPDVVAIERVFSQHNVRTVMGTAQASGVVALLAARAGLPVAFHTPSEVKAAVTGEGRAGKAQVTAMVTRLLSLQEAPRPADAADALALAICHCWRAPVLDRLAAAKVASDELARVHRTRLAAAARGAKR